MTNVYATVAAADVVGQGTDTQERRHIHVWNVEFDVATTSDTCRQFVVDSTTIAVSDAQPTLPTVSTLYTMQIQRLLALSLSALQSPRDAIPPTN